MRKCLIAVDGSNRTEWERQREREEFARTARVVEPLGSSLSARFTRSQKEVATEQSTEEEVYWHSCVGVISQKCLQEKKYYQFLYILLGKIVSVTCYIPSWQIWMIFSHGIFLIQ